MTFQEQIAADLASVIDTGEATVEIVYTPKGGEAVTRNAVALPENTDTDSNNQGEARIHRQDFVILTDAVKGIANPMPEDVITYGGFERRVSSVDSRYFGKARISTVAPETTAKHGEMHKKRAT